MWFLTDKLYPQKKKSLEVIRCFQPALVAWRALVMTDGCVAISSGAHSQLVNDDALYKEKKDMVFSVILKSAVDMKTSTTPFQ